MAQGDVHDQVSDQYLQQFDRSIGVSGMQKLQSFSELQKLGHAGTLSHQKEDFHGLKDFNSQMSKYSNISHTLRVAWNLIKYVAPNNPSIADKLSIVQGIGKVGKEFLSIHNFGQVFSLSPGDLKTPGAVQSKASIYTTQSTKTNVVESTTDTQSIGGGAGLSQPGNANQLQGVQIIGLPTNTNNTLQFVDGRLIWQPVSGGGGGGSGTLAGDTDVTITTPSNGQLLQYNSSSGKWVNHTLVAGDIPNIAESQVTGLVSDLNSLTISVASKAPSASPAFTGTPTAPTAAGGTNTTQIATTAFVSAAVSAISDVDELSTLGDVLLTSPTSGQYLKYNGTKWINASIVLASSLTNASHKWLNSYDASTGLFTQTQPDYSDLTGAPQLPITNTGAASNFLTSYNSVTGLFTEAQPTFTDLAAHPTTLSGYGITDAISSSTVLPSTKTLVTHQFFTSYDSVTGLFTAAQPAASDITGLATVATTGAYSDLSGTPSLAQTKAAVTSNWIRSYDATTGLFTASQPAFTDVSGTATTGQIPDLSSLYLPLSGGSLSGNLAVTGQISATKRSYSGQTTITFSATPTFNLSLADSFLITLTGNVTGPTFTNLAIGQKITLIINQDGTGGRTWNWAGANVTVNNAPSINTASGAYTILTFTSDGTALYTESTTSSTGGSLPGRTTVTISGGSLNSMASGTSVTGSMTMAKAAELQKIVTNFPARIRLYSTAAARDSATEVSRSNTIPPTPGTEHGVLADLYLTSVSGLTWLMYPPAQLVNQDSTVASTIYYSVSNLDTVSRSLSIIFTYLAQES